MTDFENGIFEAERQDTQLLRVPEVVIQEERGLQLLSLLFKAEDSSWGETETVIAQEVAGYFSDHQLSIEIFQALGGLRADGVDEETLRYLATTYQHPERADQVFKMAKKYKPHIKKPKEVYQKFLIFFEAFDTFWSESPLAVKIESLTAEDKERRLLGIEASRERIRVLVDFFRPDRRTVDIKKVSFVPTDPLRKKNSGQALSVFSGEQIIVSHIDNILNQDHEFLHGLVNPVVDKLIMKMSPSQKEKVLAKAPGKLRDDYGDSFYSLLCEEFIRVYTELFARGKKPSTYEDFAIKVSGLSDADFAEALKQETQLGGRLRELGISSREELLEKSKVFYDRFMRDELQDLVYKFYEDYSAARSSDDKVNFEGFVLKSFLSRLDELT